MTIQSPAERWRRRPAPGPSRHLSSRVDHGQPTGDERHEQGKRANRGTVPVHEVKQQGILLHMATQSATAGATAPEDQLAVARLFSVLADPTRVALLELLLERPRTVRELVEATGAPRSRVSNHLACLRWCGFATSERSGRDVIYRVADGRVGRVLTQGRHLADERAEHLASCRRIGPDWI
jgi:DNA-binding transcriptional ArsR family regulator